MYFASYHDLLTMDGHGIYVWTAVLVTAVVLCGLLAAPIISRRTLLKEVSRDILREQARDSALGNNQGEV